jgi:hypothetical protein
MQNAAVRYGDLMSAGESDTRSHADVVEFRFNV